MNIQKFINTSIYKFILKRVVRTEKSMLYILKNEKKENSRIAKQLKLKVEVKDNTIQITDILPSYSIFVDKGRRPGKQPPLKSIESWCKSKGIPRDAAFPIARNIGLKGIKPTNFMKPLEKFRALMKDVSEIAKEIRPSLIEMIKEEVTKDIKK